jgi:hypothetical protein
MGKITQIDLNDGIHLQSTHKNMNSGSYQKKPCNRSNIPHGTMEHIRSESHSKKLNSIYDVDDIHTKPP